MKGKRKASEFFDIHARDFDALYGGRRRLASRLIDRFFRKSMRLRYRKTIEGCHPAEGKSALDIGCGPGHYSIALAKKGLAEVWGMDFAPAMIELAEKKAELAGVAKKCRFILDDFMRHDFDRKFDYMILIGFMDYVSAPVTVIEKALSLTGSKAFFSFPAYEGLLAWQRRKRYRYKTSLFMYRRSEVERLFRGTGAAAVKIEKIGRDYFVTVIVG
jgi:cyclopropane fatty-acyl-phospholipid synthase-like methyltransferase